MDGVLAGRPWPSDREFDGGDFDRFNERRRSAWGDADPADVRARLVAARRALLPRVRRLSPSEIRDDAAWGWIFDALHGHVFDHLGAVEGWADQLRVRQADGDPFVEDPRPASLEAFWSADRAVAGAMDRLLEDLTAADWTAEPVTPGWTLRDHVAHLADWGDEGADAIRAYRWTGRWAADPEEGIDAWNERMVQARRDEPPRETLDRYRRAMQAMRTAIAALTLEELRDPEGWAWAHDCLDGHVAKHLAMLGPWAARRRWPADQKDPA